MGGVVNCEELERRGKAPTALRAPFADNACQMHRLCMAKDSPHPTSPKCAE